MTPYIEDNTLIIPFDSDRRFRWWAGGQTIIETLVELDRIDLKDEYRTQLPGMKMSGE